MEEVRVLEREEAREREKRKNEIYDLLDPSFYVLLPFPILEVHDTLRNDWNSEQWSACKDEIKQSRNCFDWHTVLSWILSAASL